ncbi:hypothetical protein [Photobacterium halotolerans]|uniref:hypothetical protein n=1 Tax=Photobacterium halotolerans TaxID=265726 RepID=UPI0006985DC6|nr:hypothetical protein [Photobacterium halotolerans]
MSYEIIEARRLAISDLKRVISPRQASWVLQTAPYVTGLSNVMEHGGIRRNLSNIMRKIESGELILLGNNGDVFNGNGELAMGLPYGFASRIRYLQANAKPTRFVKANYAPFDPNTNLFDTVIGGAKQLANDFIREQRSSQAEWMADKGIVQFTDTTTGQVMTSDEVAQRYLEHGEDILTFSNEAELNGAELLKENRHYSTILPVVSLAASGFRNPIKYRELLEKSIQNSRSLPEALGKLGMEHAKERLGIKDHPDYVDRYHGPDSMGFDKDNLLVEIESKGTAGASRAVGVNVDNMKQGSAAKNRKRGSQMVKKRTKVGVPSNRQGGPYKQAELDMWQLVTDLQGNKRHLMVNTDTETGRVKVYEQDTNGDIIDQLDDFIIDGYKDTKAHLSKLF